MGGVAPRDAVQCVRLAASDSRPNGGLCGNVGSSSAPVDPGPSAGAADRTTTTARGKTRTLR